MIRKIVFILLTIAFVAGCKSGNNITVKGTIENPKEDFIRVWMVDVNSVSLLDSTKVSEDGTFRLKFRAEGPEFYQVGYSPSDFVTLLIFPDDRITVEFTDSILHKSYSLEGSAESEKIRQQNEKLAATLEILDSLEILYSLANTDPSAISEREKLEGEINNVVMDQRSFSIDFILNNISSLSSINAIYQKFNPSTYVLYDQRDLQIMKLLTDTLTLKYPGSRQVKAMADDFDNEMNNLRFRQLQAYAENIEPEEINPNLLNIEGKRVSLLSLRGKYVLLTFWRSDSKESLASNRQLVQLYNRYHSKGFEIYQISMDDTEEIWKNAVRYDEIPWISVREDDVRNSKYAIIYNVKSLPTNYLYDKTGEIIGSNLQGRTLAIKLEQIFGF